MVLSGGLERGNRSHSGKGDKIRNNDAAHYFLPVRPQNASPIVRVSLAQAYKFHLLGMS
jgi:hypothetical protein